MLLTLRESSLPIRYLGLPLVPGKLNYLDCRPLIEKITRRINAWTFSYLSSLGILRLLQSVLYSVSLGGERVILLLFLGNLTQDL